MKIYFIGSQHNPEISLEIYRRITDILTMLGHVVEAPVLKQTIVKEPGFYAPKERAEYYKKLKHAINIAEVVIAEVSYPSTVNIGYQVSLALDLGKPVVALYQPNRQPGVLQGIDAEKFVLVEYTPDDLKSTLEYGLDEAQTRIDVRFNFFIPPNIGSYLDAIAKKKRIPRAVYLRRLIEEDMKNNKEFNKEE